MSEAFTIYVLAGVNGSGKSSIGGANLESMGLEYYNPDAAAKNLRDQHPEMSQMEANSYAWHLGKELLERAIEKRQTIAIETTLGGQTITNLLIDAAKSGAKIKIWYVGLESVDMNIERVRARVKGGGHDIPEINIRKRWNSSRRNLISLMPHLNSVRVYDNSFQANPQAGEKPRLRLLLHVANRTIRNPNNLSGAPEWAKAIIAAAIRAF